MAYQDHLVAVPAAHGTIESCWMCGIRLPTDRMMPDGGSACPDVRWYCQDSRSCTERWTSHSAGSVAVRHAAGGSTAAQAPGATVSQAVSSWHTPNGLPQRVAGPGTGTATR